MAQAKPQSTTTLSRRTALSAGIAALVLPAESLSAPAHADPIFQAIAEHKLASERLDVELDGIECDLSAAEFRVLRKPVDAAMATVISTLPTTIGGLSALLWYIEQDHLSLSHIVPRSILARRGPRAFAQAGAA